MVWHRRPSHAVPFSTSRLDGPAGQSPFYHLRRGSEMQRLTRRSKALGCSSVGIAELGPPARHPQTSPPSQVPTLLRQPEPHRALSITFSLWLSAAVKKIKTPRVLHNVETGVAEEEVVFSLMKHPGRKITSTDLLVTEHSLHKQ